MRFTLLFMLIGGVCLSDGRRLEYITEEVSNEDLEITPKTFNPNLKSLTISKSKIHTLEHLSTYKHLEILTFRDCNIFMINETFNQILKLKNLQELSLINSIKTFNLDTLKKLPNLKHLNLANNPGIAIHGSGVYSKLTRLNLANNRINNLSEFDGLKDLRFLEELILDGNSLHTIPTYFTKLSKLKSISAKENPLRNVPDEIKTIVHGYIMEDITSTTATAPDSVQDDEIHVQLIKTSLIIEFIIIVFILFIIFYFILNHLRN